MFTTKEVTRILDVVSQTSGYSKFEVTDAEVRVTNYIGCEFGIRFVENSYEVFCDDFVADTAKTFADALERFCDDLYDQGLEEIGI